MISRLVECVFLGLETLNHSQGTDEVPLYPKSGNVSTLSHLHPHPTLPWPDPSLCVSLKHTHVDLCVCVNVKLLTGSDGDGLGRVLSEGQC